MDARRQLTNSVVWMRVQLADGLTLVISLNVLSSHSSPLIIINVEEGERRDRNLHPVTVGNLSVTQLI